MPRRTASLLIAIACTALACLLLSPPWLFPRQDQSMRPCLPLRFDTLLPKWRRPAECAETIKMSAGTGTNVSGTLVAFLKEQRRAFLEALERGDGRGWVVVMGNEAGDLDSLASSIAYAALSLSLSYQLALPLLLTPRKYMSLRPENALALHKALIPPDSQNDTFLHLEDLPVDSHALARLGVKFALVDHNTLLPPFRDEEATEDPVVAIIDHHADDGHHRAALPRVIQIPTGSTTSLVTLFFKDKWRQAIQSGSAPPGELATLLLSGILIDTGALKAAINAKTTDTDRAAAEFLWQISTSSQSFQASSSGGMTIEDLTAGRIDASLSVYADALFTAKNDVSGLSTHDLLFRDYKEYSMETASPGEELTVGLSTVPFALAPWLSRDQEEKGLNPGWKPFVLALDAWMTERKLDIAGVLTTFNDPLKEASPTDSPTSKLKGKHRRELAVFIRAREPVSSASITRAREISKALIKGIQAAGPILDVQVWKPSKPFNKDKGESLVQGLEDELMAPQKGKENARFGCVWRQGNASSTRKQVAPLIKDIIATIPASNGSAL